MHEISVMTQIVESAIEEIKKHNLKNVDKIYLEIGELTFLAEEQLKFAYSLLTEKTILEKTKLIITKRKAKIECKRCGYKGALDYSYNESFHFSLPVFCCSRCKGEIKIIQGNECVIKKITGETNV